MSALAIWVWYATTGASEGTHSKVFRYVKVSEGNLEPCIIEIRIRYLSPKDRKLRTVLKASCPNSRSPFFQATIELIFLFESLFNRTSKGTPGFIKNAVINSVPSSIASADARASWQANADIVQKK